MKRMSIFVSEDCKELTLSSSIFARQSQVEETCARKRATVTSNLKEIHLHPCAPGLRSNHPMPGKRARKGEH